ncbi:hypothetical protein [Streptomyces sp. NPDC101455]|uniref:hypothetical protein n=1 Tax=Streptomyces sp. NPDC101455 TaxID=3366142 RepID=UPI00382EBC66
MAPTAERLGDHRPGGEGPAGRDPHGEQDQEDDHAHAHAADAGGPVFLIGIGLLILIEGGAFGL